MAHYSLALDEIWKLRRALAYEAGVTQAHLSLKSFPKSRRAYAETQVRRMQSAASGHIEMAYAGLNTYMLQEALRDASGQPTLTRSQWEEQRGIQ